MSTTVSDIHTDRTATLFDSSADFRCFTLSHCRWDECTQGVVFDSNGTGEDVGGICRGMVESPEVCVPSGFDQAVVSWNTFTPPGSYLVVYVRARVGGSWSGWYNMGMWTRDNQPCHRTSLKGQDDCFGKVETDTLILKQKADAYRLRVELATCDGKTYPELRCLAVSAVDSNKPAPDVPAQKLAWGRELDVPELSQLSVEGGGGWCSPTSVAMVLDYWSKVLHRPELKHGITETAKAVYDEAWNGTGNWVFNTAYAGEYKGIRAYVTRFDSIAEIEEWVAKGVPVIVSVDYNRLNRRNRTDSMGHLMVIRGFTKDGDPIFNDPWARLDDGQTVRKIFKRADLEYGWLGAKGSHGTVYLVYPTGDRVISGEVTSHQSEVTSDQ